MPTTRSQVPGGLPQLGWGTNASNAQRAAATLARDARAEARAQEANRANVATLAVLAGANRNPDVPPEANANCNPKVAVANKEDPNEADPNPCDQNPPHEVWMSVQACGAHDPDVAKSLAKNPFMSNFSRDASRSLGRMLKMPLRAQKRDLRTTSPSNHSSRRRCLPSITGLRHASG